MARAVYGEAVTFLQQIEAFAGLGPRNLRALAALSEVVSVRPGELVWQAGEPWEALYFILSGRVQLVTARAGGNAIPIDTLREGAHFGEWSPFSKLPAAFSAYGDAPATTLLCLGQAPLETFLGQHPSIRKTLQDYSTQQAIQQFLAQSTIFAQVPPARLATLVRSLRQKTPQPGELLIREGERGKEVYIVADGRLQAFHQNNPQHVLSEQQRGDVIGEIALVTRQRRTASVVAVTSVTVYVVPEAEFLALRREHTQLATSIDHLLQQRLQREHAAAQPPPSQTASASPGPGQDVRPEASPAIALVPYKIPWKHRFGRFPAVRQQSIMDCGAACLATVCRYYGKHVSLNRMRELARVGASGASMLNLLRAANTLGFDTTPFLATYDHLLASHVPAIVNWQGYHWVVVYRVTPTQVTLADPAQGLKKLSREEFLAGWTRYTLYLHPTERLAAVEESKPTLQQFLPYVTPYARVLGEIALATLGIQIFSIFLPLCTKFIIDEVIVKQQEAWLWYSLLVMSCAVALHLGLSFCRQHLLLFVTLKTNLLMVSDFYRHVLSLPLWFFERRKVGDITSRFQETRKITAFLTETGLQSFLDMVMVMLYLGIMLYVHVSLTLLACVFLLLHLGIVYGVTPHLQHGYREVFQKGADSQSFLIESLSGLSTIKTLGIERLTRWTAENLQIGYTNAYFRTLKFGMLSELGSGLVHNLSDVAVLFYGAVLVLRNQLTIGELVAFTALMKSFSAPMTALVGVWDTLQETLNAVERLNDVFEATPEVTVTANKEKMTLPTLRGAVHFDNVTFRYDEEGKNVLQNITLEVQPGERIAFVGRSGSGKSTLIKLLYGFYTPSSGAIYVDGFDLRDIWVPSLRQQLGLVPQRGHLFRGTIRENIASATPHAALAEIMEAATLAGAHDFISSFPQGYDTLLQEGGTNLSGGQRQRITIARALLHNPRLLILDEATAALDNEAERFVQRSIDTALRDRTVLMIAHRLSTVRHADRIVVIDHGNILEQGTHDQLLANKGLYYYLSTQQLQL